MILALLLAVTAWGQSTGTPSIPLQDQLQISNLGKAVKALESGKPVITGEPRFINGICFDSAGTDCQTTAASSSDVCQVVQSTRTAGIPGTTTTNTTLTGSVAGSTVTLPSNVTAGNYARVCGRVSWQKNNNNGTGIFGVGVIVNGDFVGPGATNARPVWSAKGNANTVVFQHFGGECWTHPTALSAGSLSAALQIMSTNASDTMTFHGGTDFANWFILQEVTCAD